MSTSLLVVIIVLLVVAALVVVANMVARRKGYSIPGKTVVRCSQGHLFTTTWVAGTAFTAVRLGLLTRYQRCPVGKHWAIVHPIKDEALTDENRRMAAGARRKHTS